MEEEEKEKIKKGNQILLNKIISAEEKPSNYSKLFPPKNCPSFNKEIMYYKRIKKEIENYKDNVRFYNKIQNVGSIYNYDKMKKNKKVEELKNDIINKIELKVTLFLEELEKGYNTLGNPNPIF